MTDEPVNLDERRSHAAKIASKTHLDHLMEFQAQQADLRRSQDELEQMLLAAPANAWPDVAAKARYLIQLFAATAEAQEAGRMKLIARTLGELSELCERENALK
jgi:hypothetical protein